MPIRRDSKGRFAGGGGSGGGGRRQAGSGKIGGHRRGTKAVATGRAKSRLNRAVGNQTGRLVNHNGTVSRVGGTKFGSKNTYSVHPVRPAKFAHGLRHASQMGEAGKFSGKTAGLAMAKTVGSRRGSAKTQLRAKLGGKVGHAYKSRRR